MHGAAIPGNSIPLPSSWLSGDARAFNGGMPAPVRRLAALANLTSDDFKVLNGLKGRTIVGGTVLDASSASLILAGWCARISPDGGERQITGFLLPGDGFGLGGAAWAGDELNVLTLASCVIVDAASLETLARLGTPAHANLAEACRRLAWLEQTYCLNHIVRLAGRSAYRRVAHLVVELYFRLLDVGMVRSGAFATPISQQVIADALGLSAVHLNRITRRLRQEGLVDFPRGVIRVCDPERLALIAGFKSSAPHEAS